MGDLTEKTDDSSWWGDLGDWASRNQDWLKPAATLALGAVKTISSSSSRNGIADILKSQVDRDYQAGKDYYNAYNQYQQQVMAANQANASARAAASARNAAAAAANARAKQQAAIKGNNVQVKKLQGIAEMFTPYKDSVQKLIPEASTTYSNSLSGINGLLSNLLSTDSINKMNSSVPAYTIDLPLPSYLKGQEKK